MSVLVAAAAALALAACSETTSGSGSAAGAGGASSAGGGSGAGAGASSSAASGPANSAADLVAQLVSATKNASTVHMTLSEGATAAGEGDIKTAAGGKTEAFSFTVGAGDQSVSMVYVDGTGYVKLPTSEQTDPTKPWAQVSDTSANPVVKALAASFDQIQTQSSISRYAAFVQASSDFTVVGPTTVNGTNGTKYSMTLDPSKLPTDEGVGAAAAGVGPIPLTIVVDDQGRPLEVDDTVTAAGQTITITVTLSDYGKDVQISAPPADQTSTG